jgi:hypothetical protein
MNSTPMNSTPRIKQAIQQAIADRLFVFDMDGTLLVRTTTCIEIAKVSGTLDSTNALRSAIPCLTIYCSKNWKPFQNGDPTLKELARYQT